MKYALLISMLFASTPAFAGGLDHDHAAWSRLLAAHVRDGAVDYGAIKASGQLAAYLSELEAVSAADMTRFSRSQKLAFWLNAYNAYTVKLIVDNYPVASIRKIGAQPSAAFSNHFISLAASGRANDISLNVIEHEIVRPRFADPRVHFALVCAARSCPALRPEAYRGADLETQLEDQAQTFFNDERKNRWDAAAGVLHVSKILDWFKGDFEKTGKSVAEYVALYVKGLDAAAVRELKYLHYDWALNGR